MNFNPNTFGTLSLGNIGSNTLNDFVKSTEQEAYDQCDKLNQHIFEKHMNKIKQMMTIAILETQTLLDTIYDVKDKNKKFV